MSYKKQKGKRKEGEGEETKDKDVLMWVFAGAHVLSGKKGFPDRSAFPSILFLKEGVDWGHASVSSLMG